jgi:sugar lactone lactonase YvrE
MAAIRSEVIAEGLSFGEGPRWHDAQLWVSDMWNNRVVTVGDDGTVTTIVEADDRLSGLGWDRAGRLHVVAMSERAILRHEPDGSLRRIASLQGVGSGWANDMLIDANDHAFIGSFGDPDREGTPQPTALAMVDLTTGAVIEAAARIHFPNGMVVTPDGSELVVAETRGARLTAFDLAEDGTLTNRRQVADLDYASPDGICLDEAGSIWVATPSYRPPDGSTHARNECFLVNRDGEIAARIATEHRTYACMLGGDDGRTLYICTSPTSGEERAAGNGVAYIEAARVDVPHAGLP